MRLMPHDMNDWWGYAADPTTWDAQSSQSLVLPRAARVWTHSTAVGLSHVSATKSKKL